MHYIHRLPNFILIIVSLSKPKDLVIPRPWAAATEECPRRQPGLVSYTLSVRLCAGISETLGYLKWHEDAYV